MRRPSGTLELRHAVALGALHGPTELLPISSSAHTTLVPWLLGWPYAELDPELRKAFEVALHAGTAAALLVGLRDEVSAAVRGLNRRLSQAGRPTERRLPPSWAGARPPLRRREIASLARRAAGLRPC